MSYIGYFENEKYVTSLLLGVGMLALSIAAIVEATNYATASASSSVTDIILSNTRVYDVDGIFVYGALIMVLLITFTIASRAQYVPFALKTIAVFFLTRAIFVSLTHISPFPAHVAVTPSIFSTFPFLQVFFTGDDLFFSGHTGLPFLIALLFWDKPILRFSFLALSVLFGVVVLLGHLHYSIDVLAAFYIVYGIYHMCMALFPDDYRMFRDGLTFD